MSEGLALCSVIMWQLRQVLDLNCYCQCWHLRASCSF